MNETLRQALSTLRIVNAGALFNAACGTAEGLLRVAAPRALPASLDIILTKACNLRCIFCISYAPLADRHWMDIGLYRNIARQLFPTALGVYFCSGGEPLLYPHVREALQLCRTHRTRATMTSNGMLLDRNVADWMVADQSLTELCISFDGATKSTLERIRRGARYETILDNLHYLSDCKQRQHSPYPWLWFRFAIMRSNAHELPDMFRLCREYGLSKVEVKYLNVANEMDADESLLNHPQLAQEVFAAAQAKAREYGIALALPPLPAHRHVPHRCLRPWQFCQIDTDGSVRICYYCWRQRLGFVDDDFTAVWRNDHYQKIRRSIDSDAPYYPFCKFCPVRRGPGDPSAYDQNQHQDAYCIPGLESLQSHFNRRSEENVASLREIKTTNRAADSQEHSAEAAIPPLARQDKNG